MIYFSIKYHKYVSCIILTLYTHSVMFHTLGKIKIIVEEVMFNMFNIPTLLEKLVQVISFLSTVCQYIINKNNIKG